MSEFHGKTWGLEHWIVNNDLYCGKILHLKNGYRCSMHYHKMKHETFYVLKGRVLMEVNDAAWVAEEGHTMPIKQRDSHRFTGLEDSEILEVSTRHYEDDSYRSTISEKISEEEFNGILDNWKV